MVSIDSIEDAVENAIKSVGDSLRGKNPGSPQWTADLKESLRTLATTFGYKACCTGGERREWLYDLTWLEFSGDTLADVPLAMESEWNRYGTAILLDFQKLIVSRARLRVMIFETINDQETERVIGQLCAAVRGYAPSLPTDRYLFAVWQSLPEPAVFKFERFTV